MLFSLVRANVRIAATFGLTGLAAALTLSLPSARAQTLPPSAPVAAAKNQTSKVFSLRWIKPSRFVEQFAQAANHEGQTVYHLLLPGISRMSPDDAKKQLLIHGTPEAMTRVEEAIGLVDVEPRYVHLTARILRAPAIVKAPADGKPLLNYSIDNKLLPKSVALTTVSGAFSNNETQMFSAVGDGQFFRVQLTPHINGDGSVSITASLSPLPTTSAPQPYELVAESGSIPNKYDATTKDTPPARTETRRTPNETPIYVLYTPSFQNAEQAFYLEITPNIAPRSEER